MTKRFFVSLLFVSRFPNFISVMRIQNENYFQKKNENHPTEMWNDDEKKTRWKKLKHHSLGDRSKEFKLLNYVALVYLFYFYLPFNNDLKKIKSYGSKFNFSLWSHQHFGASSVLPGSVYTLRLDTYFSFPFRRLSQKVLCCAWEFFYLCLCARVKWMVNKIEAEKKKQLRENWGEWKISFA